MRRQAEMFNVVNGELVLRHFRHMDRIQTNFLTQNVLRNVSSDLARFLPPIVRPTRRLLRSGFGSALRVGPISTVTMATQSIFSVVCGSLKALPPPVAGVAGPWTRDGLGSGPSMDWLGWVGLGHNFSIFLCWCWI